MRKQRRRKKNPIDQLINELIESPAELVEITLFFTLIALVTAELAQQEMMAPIREIFSMYLLFSDIILYILLIGAIVYIFNAYNSRETLYSRV